MPAMILEILQIGKDERKFDNDQNLIEFVFNNKDAFFDYEILSKESMPAIGLKEIENKALRLFTSKKGKREDFKNYLIKKSKSKNK